MDLRRLLCHVSIWLLLTGIFGSGTLQAQLIPGFTADKDAGCSPLSVSFTNTTSGASASARYKWNFGNGNTLTTTDISSPVAAIYYNPRTYTVKLTVEDKGVTTSKSIKISVYSNPTGSFTILGPTGCAPLVSSFSSTSIPGSGTVAQYFWDFGDGKTLNTTAPTVRDTFTSAGNYTPGLTVTNSYGCSSTIQQPNAVVVWSSPTAAFAAVSTTLCKVTDPAEFNNTSTGTGALKYWWDFGDGSGSASVNPQHRYAAPGVYTVRLTVTNAQGCSNTLTRSAYIDVAQFFPAFSQSAGSLCAGSSVLFSDKSTPAASGQAQWSFGDGTTGTGDTVSHTFLSTGKFTVILTDSFGHCTASIAKTVSISPAPNLNGFKVGGNVACQAPVLVSFSDTSQGSVKWWWHFTANAGDTSTLKNPSFLFTANQVYHPALTVTNASGCSSTVSQTIYPSAATASLLVNQTFSASSKSCAVVTAQCNALSPAGIAKYAWSFGDGTTSAAAAPSHAYSVPGTYFINLSFTTTGGCQGTAGPDTVHVYPKPKAAFNALDSTHCGSSHLELFYNLSDSAAQYDWIYGDGSSGINNDSVHSHLYGRTGSYTMTLIASSPGCSPDTAVITRYLVTGLAPYGYPANTCNGNRDTVVMTQQTPGASEYIWQWGDHTKNDTDKVYLPSRTHIYAKSGIYSASITGVFGACTQSSGAIPVYVLSKQRPLLASPDSVICGSGSLPISISGLDSNYKGAAADSGYSYVMSAWQYGDGTTFGSSQDFKTVYNTSLTNLTPGKDSLRAVFQSTAFGCYDTTNYIPLKIGGPLPGFSAKGGTGCSSGPVTFTDASRGTVGVPIVQWKWNFGDGASVLRTTGDTVTHTYPGPGKYVPTLTVTDAGGCSKTDSLPVSDSIVITGPRANFYWAPVNIQPGLLVTFYNSSRGNPGTTYEWYFGDKSTSNAADSVQHTYAASGKDTVRLIALSGQGAGCVDTLLQVVNVSNVSAAFTDTTEYISSAGCPPVVAYFKSTEFNASTLHWDFGDGATAGSNPAPSHTYNQPGVYQVTLIAYGAGGDSTVVHDSIFVKGPEGAFRSSLFLACAPATDTLHATGRYVSSYTWDFGDGTVVTTTDTLAIHTYASAGLYSPALLLSDSAGCQAVYHLNNKVVMDTLNVQLNPLPLLCDTGSVAFRPSVYSLAADSLQDTLLYHWNFGTGHAGDTSNIADPTFDYTRSGIHLALLQVQSPTGCTAAVTDTVQVVPALSFHGSLFLACTPATDTLYATGGRQANAFTWNFGDGTVDTSSDTLAVHTYIRPGIYAPTLHLSDSTGCPTDFHLNSKVIMDSLHVQLNPLTFLCDTGNVLFHPSVYSLTADSLQDTLIYHWIFGTGHPGDTASTADPSFDYNRSGIHVALLQVQSPAGCSAAAADTVQIVSALTFHSSLFLACTPATDTLHATGQYAGSYTWDFGDGTVATTTDTLAVHTYVRPGIYAPSLHLSDSAGCQADYHLADNVVMDTLSIKLSSLPLLCDTGSVAFHPSVYSLTADSLQEILIYHWSFGTGHPGDTASIVDPSFDYTRSGIHVALLQVQSPAGCSATAADTVQIAPTLDLQYSHNTELCTGDSVVLEIKGGNQYQWQTDPTLTVINDSSALARPVSTTTYSVIATDQYHCFSDTALMQVTVKPLPTVNILPLAPVPVGSTITLEANTSPDVVSQTWSPATYLSCTECAAPQCTPDSPITYIDQVTTALGCTASDTVVVAIVCSEGAIHVPGGFTPNHDGRNDYFIPMGHGVKMVTHFQIYSRWGQLVYTAENLPLGDEKLGWDGTYNGRDMPVGTYVYMLQVACYTGETFMVKGTVELIR